MNMFKIAITEPKIPIFRFGWTRNKGSRLKRARIIKCFGRAWLRSVNTKMIEAAHEKRQTTTNGIESR